MIASDGPFCPFIHVCDHNSRPYPWEVHHRRLAHYLLVTNLEGDEDITVDEEHLHIPVGTTYLIQPGALHNIRSLRGNRPAWIHFDLRYDANRRDHPHAGPYEADLDERAAFLQPGCPAVFGIDLPILAPPAIARLARNAVPRLIDTWQLGGPLDVVAATHQLTGLILSWVEYAWQAAGTEPTQDNEARIARAEAIALRSLHTSFGIEDFARSAGLSRSRFCAVFTKLRNISPGGWIRRERLRRAEQLLARGDLSVARIGSLVGYPDLTVFGRVFRAHSGLSPSLWRTQRSSS